MDRLPEELLLHIVSFLEDEPPSVAKLSHEPSFYLTNSESRPLKSLSCTCRRWRRILIPVLFQYIRIGLSDEAQYVMRGPALLDYLQCNYDSLNDREKRIFLRLKQHLHSGFNLGINPENPQDIYDYVHEDDKILQNSRVLTWCPHLSKGVQQLLDFIKRCELQDQIRSLVVQTFHDSDTHPEAALQEILFREIRMLWTKILSHMNPNRIVIAAPPATLASLVEVPGVGGDLWAFEMKMHYLELQQNMEQTYRHNDSCRRIRSPSILHRRPWTSLGYNEGSSVPAYSTYEYFWKRSPTLLYSILLRLQKETAECCGIRSFSFTGVFPFARNHATLLLPLTRMPSLRSLRYQLTPGRENDVLDNKDKLRRAQYSDLWNECDRCYREVLSFLAFLPEVSVFSTSDACLEGVLSEVFQTQATTLPWRKNGPCMWEKIKNPDEVNGITTA